MWGAHGSDASQFCFKFCSFLFPFLYFSTEPILFFRSKSV
jgi:hypothetical protein